MWDPFWHKTLNKFILSCTVRKKNGVGKDAVSTQWGECYNFFVTIFGNLWRPKKMGTFKMFNLIKIITEEQCKQA